MATLKEQTAFRFEPALIQTMKRRAQTLRVSLNTYVTGVIERDLLESHTFPKVDMPETFDEDIARFAGAMRHPTETELAEDDRLARIWLR